MKGKSSLSFISFTRGTKLHSNIFEYLAGRARKFDSVVRHQLLVSVFVLPIDVDFQIEQFWAAAFGDILGLIREHVKGKSQLLIRDVVFGANRRC